MHQPDPERYQPTLTPWSQVWRLAVCLFVSALAWGPISVAQWREAHAFFWVDLGVGAVAYVLLFYRRRWPFPIALLVTIATGFSAAAAGPGLLVTVSLATRRVMWQLVTVGVLGVVVSQVFFTYQPQPADSSWWVNLGFSMAFGIASIALGLYLGSRRELLWTLRDRARRAEQEQGLRVAQARANERALIAREMHDVLAHRISLVTMHAGALAYRDDLTPEQVKESAGIIQHKAHEALADLREVLGVLRGDDLTSADRPQPTYADVPALVQEARQAGMRVDLELDDMGALAEQTGRTVYRVVQEGLTNARKHAPYAAARVCVTESVGGVLVTVWNPTSVGHHSSTPGAGLGLVGLAERVELLGGSLSTHADGGGFTLRAWLPRAGSSPTARNEEATG